MPSLSRTASSRACVVERAHDASFSLVELHAATLGARRDGVVARSDSARRQVGFELGPADDPASYPGRRRRARDVQYVQRVSRIETPRA